MFQDFKVNIPEVVYLNNPVHNLISIFKLFAVANFYLDVYDMEKPYRKYICSRRI